MATPERHGPTSQVTDKAVTGGVALVRDGRPLYRQLADDLRRRIDLAEFVAGDSLPTEARLSAEYHASRITVRHALGLLEQEGLLHRQQGKGSFVRPRAITVGPRRLTSFSEEVRERGQVHSSAVIGVSAVEAPDDVPLDLGEASGCVRLERIRRADGAAIAHQVTLLPADLGEGLAEALTTDGSLYEFLRTSRALEVDSADETYRVAAADATAASLLGIEAGAPVFVVERVGFAGGRRIEWTRSTVVGDGYEVHVHLRR